MGIWQSESRTCRKVRKSNVLFGLAGAFGASFDVWSNPEAGYRLADVLIRPKQPGHPGILLEVKVKAPNVDPDIALESEAHQARKMRYWDALHKAGVERVYEYALAFDGKDVLVAQAEAKAKMAAREGTGAKRKDGRKKMR